MGILADCLKASAPSRIVNTSSLAHGYARFDVHNEPSFQSGSDYDFRKAYNCSKLANVLHTRELAHRLRGTGTQNFGPKSTEITASVVVCTKAYLRAVGNCEINRYGTVYDAN